jgi:hypothetical protein
LYILEQRFPTDFNALLRVPDSSRPDFIDAWERWGRAEDGVSKPDGVSDATADWAGSEPSLVSAATHFDHYVNLAAAFTSFSAGSGLSDEDLKTLADLSHESDVYRKEAIKRVVDGDPNTRGVILEKLLTRLASFEHPAKAIESACEIAKSDSGLAEAFAHGIRSYGLKNLEMGDALEIANAFPAQGGIASQIAESPEVNDFIRSAVSDHLSRAN